jgi:N-acetylglucosaminyldiphosphoundecaprenol N-acetyl-beta-D-mannosaminyltransferase
LATEALALTGTASEPVPTVTLFNTENVSLIRPRVNLGGVLVDQVDFDSAVDRIERFVTSGGAHQIATVNLDFVAIARRRPEFMEVLNQVDLAVPDGMPLVWLSRLTGTALTERVAGVELFGACCEIAAEQQLGIFLLGAADGVAEEAGKNLQELYPGLRIVGSYSPSLGALSEEEDDYIVELIQQAQPHFLFVALGAPRQDVWIREHMSRLHVPVSMGVGCVFDIYAGAVKRAPKWMQQFGLEWAFRLAQEPARLWRRYLVDDLPTFAAVMLSTRATKPAPAPTLAAEA